MYVYSMYVCIEYKICIMYVCSTGRYIQTLASKNNIHHLSCTSVGEAASRVVVLLVHWVSSVILR